MYNFFLCISWIFWIGLVAQSEAADMAQISHAANQSGGRDEDVTKTENRTETTTCGAGVKTDAGTAMRETGEETETRVQR